MRSLSELPGLVGAAEPRTLCVAAAEDTDVMALMAGLGNLCRYLLVGDQGVIEALMAAQHIPGEWAEIVHEPDHGEAARRAVALARDGRADLVMKGHLHTAQFLKAVLDRERGLGRGGLLSQVSVFDKVDGGGLCLLTDCAMAIAPTLDEKAAITENAVGLAHQIGIDCPKVAVLSALETVNPKIQDTVEAAALSKMADRGQITGCLVDGPLAFDNAVSAEAARHKGIGGPVAGRADILVAPNLQVGNALLKSLVFMAKLPVAAALVGAAKPVVMTSRSDTVENKILSVMLALFVA